MKKNFVKQALVLGVLFLCLGMTLNVMSSTVQDNSNQNTSPVQSSQINPLVTDDGYPPRYVMDFVELTPDSELSAKPAVTKSLPTSFSWTNYNGNDWTTKAKDQANCGSCWAFGAVSALESRINIAWDTPTLDVDLAEQYILSCLPVSGSCNGGSSYSAYRCIKSEDALGNYCNGIITEDCLTYEADDSVLCSSKAADWRSHLIPISGYGSWNPHYPNDVDAIKSQIVNEGPVVTYFYATNDFARWGNSHHSSSDYYPYYPSTSSNHAVAIVGYKDDPSIPHGGYWIVKNSWGTGWGYQGFFNMEYGSLNIDNVQITWVTYNATPVAAFSYSPMNPDAGTTIQFTDASTPLLGSLTTWSWGFGDIQASQEKNPTHSYTTIGTYPITLQVTDSLGHTGSVTRNVYVGDKVPPVTTTSLFGTLGDNGWYNSKKVIIRLKPVDTFSGVNYSMYNVDGTGYVLYTGPIVFYGNDGQHTVAFYSVDTVGNKENEKTMTFRIDSGAPILSITKPKERRIYLMGVALPSLTQQTLIVGHLPTTVQTSDETSGINRVEFYLGETLLGVDTIAPYSTLIRGFSNGAEAVFTVVVYDNAGLSTTQTMTLRYMGFWF
jgi:PKD repeat protein